MTRDTESSDPASTLHGILRDCFDRVAGVVHDTLDGLPVTTITERITPTANTIGWLVWHLTRVEDDHVATLAGRDQVWHSDGWESRFALPAGLDSLGYGHSADDVAAVRADADLLAGYHDAVHAATTAWIATLTEQRAAEIIDRNWDPPVTVAVRLVSVISDCLQHAGQAALLRGLLEPGWSTADG